MVQIIKLLDGVDPRMGSEDNDLTNLTHGVKAVVSLCSRGVWIDIPSQTQRLLCRAIASCAEGVD